MTFIIRKEQPAVADTHISTALGNDRKRKWPRFKPKIGSMKKADVRICDLEPVSNALKRTPLVGDWRLPFAIRKSDPTKRQIFGWASVVTKGGELVVDWQDDIIRPDTMEKAAYDFVLNSRQQGSMHEDIGVGRLIESMVFTLEKQKVLGIDLGQEGWWTGFLVDSDDVWKAIKSGQLPEFSIGGKAVRTEVGD